jgi:hypothetical protein
MEWTEKHHNEIWQAIRHLQEKQMSQQTEIDALTAQVTDVTTEIETFVTGKTSLDLSGLTTAVTGLATAAAELSPAPVVAEPDKTVYLFTPAEGVEPNPEFTASGYQTKAAEGQTPTPVEFFSGDTAAGETNGTSITGYTVVAPADVELIPVPA